MGKDVETIVYCGIARLFVRAARPEEQHGRTASVVARNKVRAALQTARSEAGCERITTTHPMCARSSRKKESCGRRSFSVEDESFTDAAADVHPSSVEWVVREVEVGEWEKYNAEDASFSSRIGSVAVDDDNEIGDCTEGGR